MKTAEMKNLQADNTILNSRTKAQFLVQEVNSLTKKAVVVNVETDEIKAVSLDTIRRNYELVVNDNEPSEIVQEAVQPKDEVISKEAEEQTAKKAIPKPEAKQTVAKPKSAVVASSDITSFLDALQQGIEKEIKDAKRHVTGQYIAYRTKQNFVEIFEGKRSLYIMVRTSRLSEHQLNTLTKIYPASNGWSQDGKFSIRSMDDVKVALDLVKTSYITAEGLASEDRSEENIKENESSKA